MTLSLKPTGSSSRFYFWLSNSKVAALVGIFCILMAHVESTTELNVCVHNIKKDDALHSDAQNEYLDVECLGPY